MKRHKSNPLIRPKDVKASNPSFKVLGAFNPGAIQFKDEILLLIRVAENSLPEENHITIPYYHNGEAKVMRINKNDPELIYREVVYSEDLKVVYFSKKVESLAYEILNGTKNAKGLKNW